MEKKKDQIDSGFLLDCHGHSSVWSHDLANGQGSRKVQRCHCGISVMPGGELTLNPSSALVLHVL